MNTIEQQVSKSNEKVNVRLHLENEKLKMQNNTLICEIESLIKQIDKDPGAQGLPLMRARTNAQALIETMV